MIGSMILSALAQVFMNGKIPTLTESYSDVQSPNVYPAVNVSSRGCLMYAGFDLNMGILPRVFEEPTISQRLRGGARHRAMAPWTILVHERLGTVMPPRKEKSKFICKGVLI